MSVLESLMAVIGIDTKGFVTSVKEVKQGNKEVQQSFTSTDKVINKVEDSFKKLITRLSGFALAYVSIRSLTSSFTRTINQSGELNNLSESLNVSVEDLSAWSNAVTKSGGSSESFQNSIKTLTTSLTSFATKGKSLLTPFFQELGIKMVDVKGKARSAFDILPELADKFSKLSAEEAFGFGQKIGLDESTIRLLQKGRKEVEEIIRKQKELGVVTKQDAEVASKFNSQWQDTSHIFRSLFTRVATEILPVLSKLFKVMENGFKFIKDNKNLVTGVLIGIGTVLSAFLIPRLIKTGITAAIAFAPFYLLAAAILGTIAVIAILYDEIKGYLSGADSVLGEIFKRLPALEEGLRTIGGLVEIIRGTTKDLGSAFVKAFSDPLGALEDLKNSLSASGDKILELFPSLKTLGKSLSDYFKKVAEEVTFVQVVVTAVKSAVLSIIDVLSSALSRLGESLSKVKDFFNKGQSNTSFNPTQQILNQVQASPFNYNPGSNLTNNKSLNRNTTVNISDININTQATSAEGIAGSIDTTLQTYITQAINNADDGILA